MITFSRALIIAEPHINRILAGHKTWEMRSTRTKIRGRIGLIRKGSGLIVGSAILSRVALSAIDKKTAEINIKRHLVDDFELLKKWKYVWELEDVVPFRHPISYKHPQGAVIWVKV